MKVFLTGSTGFVGLNILTELVEQGHEPHLYIRPSSSRDHIGKFDVVIHEGELDDLAAMTSAMQGMDAVIHTAGDTSCFARDCDRLHQVNVVGTKNIVDAAISCGVKRLVYTSTTSTIGASDDESVQADESTTLTGFRAESPYAKTKQLAELEVQRAHDNGIESIILNPAEIVGAFDLNFQWGRLVMAVFANQVPFIPPGGGSFCAAKDVAKAHVSALTQGVSGECYLLAGDDCSYVDFLNTIAELMDKSYDQPAHTFEQVYESEVKKEQFYPEHGEDSMVEPYRMRVFSGFYYFSSAKAEKALGYRSATLKDMLGECISWYRSNGILPPG